MLKRLYNYFHAPPNSYLEDKDMYSFFFLLGILLACFLNLIDAIVTTAFVSYRPGTEANPLMAYLLDIHPLAFILFKLTIGTGAIFLLYKSKHLRSGLICLYTILILFTLVLLNNFYVLAKYFYHLLLFN